MAGHSVPQVLVFQEFRTIPAEIADPLRAHISGGHAYLLRHADPDEKPLGALGPYDPADDAAHPWPQRPFGARVDRAYTKLFIDDARLEYYRDLIGAGSAVTPVSGTRNRIRSADTSGGFKEHGESRRYSALHDRDVRPGDRVSVRGLGDDDEYHTLDTYVRALASTGGDRTAATVDSTPDADAANHATQAASAVVAAAEDNESTSTLAAVLTGYIAYADGDVDDTYTVEVVQSEVGDDPTTARLKVTSASGRDDVAAVAPAADDAAFTVGRRGLQLKITKDDEDPGPLAVGQIWTVTVHDDYVRPTVSAAGTYTGPRDTIYIVHFTRGGLFAAEDDAGKPAFVATTTTGVDASGLTVVGATGAARPVGTRGVTFTVAATGTPTGVRKGDKWYIAVTAEADGAFRTIVLGHDLPAELLEADDLDLRLAIRKDIAVPANRIGFEPAVNFEQSSTEITLKAGIVAYDPTWTDGGTPLPLDVVGGDAFVEYRAWRAELAGGVNSVSDPGDLDAAIAGPLSPDNPLKWGVFKALSNSNGTAVKFTAVADPDDIDSWARMVSLLVGREDVYNLAPMTFRRDVQDLVAAHVEAQSSPKAGRWRGAFFALEARTARPVISAATSADGGEVLATLADDPDTSGTQHTLLQVPGNNSQFVTDGVAPGDTVRALYSTAWGEETYDEFPVDAVLSENSLRLAAGPAAPITVPQKVEIWHTLTKAEVAADVAARAGSFGSRRIKAVWPDRISSGGTEMPGYFAAAAAAGLRSGVVPHQGLTNVEIAGFDDVARTTTFFNADQLDVMADAGVWVITQDPDGTVKTRHALTTDTTDLNSREEMRTANIDSMSYLFLRRLRPFIGRMNVTPTALSRLRVELTSAIEYLKSASFVESIGAQLIEGVVVRLEQHALLKDRVVAIINLDAPFPLNNMELHLIL